MPVGFQALPGYRKRVRDGSGSPQHRPGRIGDNIGLLVVTQPSGTAPDQDQAAFRPAGVNQCCPTTPNINGV
jgi:hypothetical protein